MHISAPPDGRAGITADLVSRLIAAQFPQRARARGWALWKAC
ncbi:hypothetical protein AB0K18_09080 [Nonomuraea sp. NPDC049421]